MILNNNQKEAIQILHQIDKNICFGGSVCLKAYGLMDREVGDIDVFVDKDKPFNADKFRQVADSDTEYNFTTEFNGDILDRVPLEIKGIKVCIFRVPKYLLSALVIDIDGIEIAVQNPCFAIAGKVLFSKYDAKHTKDLDAIRTKLLISNLI